MTYLITFTCYGCRLHGSESGSVDREHCARGTPTLGADPKRAASERKAIDQAPYLLDDVRRNAVLASIRDVCAYRGWQLLAAHARTTHVHVVVEAEPPPEVVLNAFKSYASRRPNAIGVDVPGRKRWSRHGSTRYLTGARSVAAAMQYVVAAQGEPMAVFESKALW